MFYQNHAAILLILTKFPKASNPKDNKVKIVSLSLKKLIYSLHNPFFTGQFQDEGGGVGIFEDIG